MIPGAILAAVERALTERSGTDIHVSKAAGVGGGCISPAARLELDNGRVLFLKWRRGDEPAGFFAAEAHSLAALARAGAVRVPRVEAAEQAWLLIEWLEPGAANASTWPDFGRRLAALHRTRGSRFGWDHDNWIGTLPQANTPMDAWPAFWAERRLAPQWERARRAGFFDTSDDRAFDRLLAKLDALLAPGNADGPSLLHGDLWGGNVHVTADHVAAVIDPSCYHGHREVDLAMTALFGGFGPGFMEAYKEAWPLEPGYEQERRELYQLYYILVHVNLFGTTYVSGARAIVRRF